MLLFSWPFKTLPPNLALQSLPSSLLKVLKFGHLCRALKCLCTAISYGRTTQYNRELKKTTFLTTRTLTGNKLHVFNQSQFCFFTSRRPCCQKRRLLKLPNTEGLLHAFSYDFGVMEIFRLVLSQDNGFPVAKYIHARTLFYEDNRNQLTWFIFLQFGMVA